LLKGPTFNADEKKTLGAYKDELKSATMFIPVWVKAAVALALGVIVAFAVAETLATLLSALLKSLIDRARPPDQASQGTAVIRIGTSCRCRTTRR